MLSKGDDFPLHQTPEPIAYSGTDRNFYDRYFFNGFAPDGGEFFAVAFGVYPHLNIADAHFSVIRDGKEYCIHASRHLNMERLDLQVGPIRIEVIEPLQKLRVTIEDTDGISACLDFDGLAFPIEEPRFIHRFGPRAFMDYTRMTQGGRYTGWIEVDGVRTALHPDTVGVRDRSWGIRPIGASDPQPHAPAILPGFYWTWTPMRFAGATYFFHICADGQGHEWNTRAARANDGDRAEDIVETQNCRIKHVFEPGTRYPASAILDITFPGEEPISISFTPLHRFLMRGVGYFHPDWQHGTNKGALAVEREDIDLAAIDVSAALNFHNQAISRLTLRRADGREESGIGVLESLVQGPCVEYGFTGDTDLA
jgi:hypothetical protein